MVVIGAGSAGTSAAIKAAEGGASVLLVDENPVAAGLIGLDVPLYYGGRATGTVQNKGRMLEQIFSADPALEAAFEAGVEVALGTYAWGAFVNGPALNALPEPVVGLADDQTSWLCGFGQLILATGARDLALSFKGWDQPGVMGANALCALLTRYDAFAGRTIVVLGSGAPGLVHRPLGDPTWHRGGGPGRGARSTARARHPGGRGASLRYTDHHIPRRG